MIHSMSTWIRFIDKRFTVKISVISCQVLIFDLSNPRTTILHTKNGLKNARYDELYTVFLNTNQWLSGFGEQWVGQHGFDSRRVLKLFTAFGHFAWRWARRCTHMNSFVLLRSYFLEFRKWWSRADRVLTLNMNIRRPLFWSTWSLALGLDSATCAGLAHGLDYSDCRASEQKSKKVLGPYFSLNCRKYLKSKALGEGFSTLTPRRMMSLDLNMLRMSTDLPSKVIKLNLGWCACLKKLYYE